ncbi:MAG: tRNA-specific adenosine deaminase subunit tad3 [Cirrosporium novae-zelandiae]|nr:MAG: tRNA-specific adenosine deaminase subunit tad3 [Cirrosporium novae-zelandiae]
MAEQPESIKVMTMTSLAASPNLDVYGGTVAETQSKLQLSTIFSFKNQNSQSTDTLEVDVHVLQVPLKSASITLNTVRKITDQDAVNLQHLRRFSRTKFLPATVKIILAENQVRPTGQKSDLDDLDQSQENGTVKDIPADDSDTDTYMLVCAAKLIDTVDLIRLLSENEPFALNGLPISLSRVPVPLLAPTSQEQAVAWTQKYWPTVYQKNNPFGAHPSIISRYETRIAPTVGTWMAMAKAAAFQSSSKRLGEQFGAIIVDGNAPGGPVPVAIAGDARRCGPNSAIDTNAGNVMAHATMRAIGMVAMKHLQPENSCEANPLRKDVFLDRPITQLEYDVYNAPNTIPSAYLCLNLDIYLTHEPCVMCAMAILHSRFKAIIFGQRVSATGAINPEPTDLQCCGGVITGQRTGGLGYGLFWRQELNWRMLAWEWMDEGKQEQKKENKKENKKIPPTLGTIHA